MGSPEDIAARVSRLEQEVTRWKDRVVQASQDAAAARVLAGGADRDVADVRSELRAHTRAMNALRETQIEFGQAQQAMRDEQQAMRIEQRAMRDEQRAMRGTLLEHGVRLDSLESEMRSGFASLRSGMAHIVTLLGGSPPPA